MEPALSSGTAAALTDLLRIVHLAAAAIGIGAMVATDFTMLRLAHRPIGPRHWRALEAAHLLIAPALLVAWASGMVLAFQATGGNPAAMTPKLAIKLGVVTLLTLDAWYIAKHIRPIMEEAGGIRLIELPFLQRLALGIAAALSVAGWCSALLLGGSEMLQGAGFTLLLPLIGAIYGIALTVAVVFALRLGLVQRRIRTF
ncbi:MAG: hypothetical protein AAGC57_11665 [Pseudomonadota bacterium]